MQNVDPALRKNGGAVFSVSDEKGDETLVVVQEVERVHRRSIDIADMVGRIREAVTNEHEVFARHVVLIRPGALPKTTSGKISTRRRAPALAREQARSPDRGRRLNGDLGVMAGLVAAHLWSQGMPRTRPSILTSAWSLGRFCRSVQNVVGPPLPTRRLSAMRCSIRRAIAAR